MDWRIEYLDDRETVLATVCGPVTGKSFRDILTVVIPRTTHMHFRNFLIDARAVRLDLSVMEIYGLPDLFPALALQRDKHLAVLYDACSPHAPDFRFLENVLCNRGFRVRLFTDYEAALAWLKTQKTLPPEAAATASPEREEERGT